MEQKTQCLHALSLTICLQSSLGLSRSTRSCFLPRLLPTSRSRTQSCSSSTLVPMAKEEKPPSGRIQQHWFQTLTLIRQAEASISKRSTDFVLSARSTGRPQISMRQTGCDLDCSPWELAWTTKGTFLSCQMASRAATICTIKVVVPSCWLPSNHGMLQAILRQTGMLVLHRGRQLRRATVALRTSWSLLWIVSTRVEIPISSGLILFGTSWRTRVCSLMTRRISSP
mmetsp:Transcript_58147/g.107061  ORF Transcript_58147/g.107061 Transcript_58147/m.107061 type:complete len:227 (-) Transcript_58147:1186-1866(-)